MYKILIADDEEDVVSLLKDYLELNQIRIPPGLFYRIRAVISAYRFILIQFEVIF